MTSQIDTYQQVIHDISKNIKQISVKPCAEIYVQQSHCAGNVQSVEKITFPLNETGRNSIALFIAIFDTVSNSIVNKREQSTEDIAQKASQKHGCNYDEALKLISLFVRCDAGFEEWCAYPESYRIEIHDGQGQVSRFYS